MTTMTTEAPARRETIDFERIDQLIAWAEGEHAKKLAGLPSEWDQDHWIIALKLPDGGCGTACCIAGKIGLEDGVLRRSGRGYSDETIFTRRWPDGEEPLYVWTYAARVLGLDVDVAEEGLFYGKNGLGDLKRIRDELAVDSGFMPRYQPEEYLVDARPDETYDY